MVPIVNGRAGVAFEAFVMLRKRGNRVREIARGSIPAAEDVPSDFISNANVGGIVIEDNRAFLGVIMPSIPKKAQTEGSSTFEPDHFFDAWAKEEITPPYDNDFRKFIIKAFALKPNDTYGYKATAEVTLLQAQTYVEFGGQGQLHKWYVDSEGNQVSHVWSRASYGIL